MMDIGHAEIETEKVIEIKQTWQIIASQGEMKEKTNKNVRILAREVRLLPAELVKLVSSLVTVTSSSTMFSVLFSVALLSIPLDTIVVGCLINTESGQESTYRKRRNHITAQNLTWAILTKST